MNERICDAIVLGMRDRGDIDKEAVFFTKELGRIDARVVSGRKITSKFSQHINPGNLVAVRVVHKNGFTLTDILPLGKKRDANYFTTSGPVLRALFILRVLLPPLLPDERAWVFVRDGIKNNGLTPIFALSLLGHDLLHAVCAACGKKPLAFFLPEQNFFCEACGSQLQPDGVIYLYE